MKFKRANGDGTVVKLQGNRRRPWAIRKVVGWKDNGRPILKYISYHKTKREAEKALDVYNNDPYTVTNKTLAELYREWYGVQEKKKAEGTLKGYRVCFNHLAPLHDMPVKDIDRYVLQRFFDDVDINKCTCKKVSQLVNMLFKYAVKRGILPSVALTWDKVVDIPDKEEKHQNPRAVIDKNDINRLWELKDVNEYARVTLVYIYTGLRFSELANLSPEDCHDNYIEIKQAKTAAGVRIVPLSDKVRSLLPIMQVSSRTTFERHYKKLLPDHVRHDTRHTFVSMMTEAGVDPRIIKAIVGHKPNDVTDIYTHIGLDVMLEAVNRL